MKNKTLGINVLFLFFTAILWIPGVLCPAQEEESNTGFWSGVARVAPFGKPFWADMHSTIIRAEMAYATNSPDYDWGEFDTSNRFYVFANLGADIPIWAGNFANGKYGLCFTLPFIIDVWLDRFEFQTSPVINTAYRFGVFDVSFLYRLDETLPVLPFLHFNVYNWGLKLSVFKHESTHIGDELTIHRMKKEYPVTRIDVAYNYAELIFTLNDPDSRRRLNHGFKFAVLFNYLFQAGWYEIKKSEADPDFVEPARFPFEFYVQYQYESALFSKGFQIIASAEYRLRERHKYPFSYAGSTDDHSKPDFVNCFNFFAGIRYDSQKFNYFSKIGIGVRCYVGLNPYGQFRSMPSYSQWGLAVLFE